MAEAETGTGASTGKMSLSERGKKGAETRRRNAELKRQQEAGTHTSGQQTQQEQDTTGTAGRGKGKGSKTGKGNRRTGSQQIQQPQQAHTASLTGNAQFDKAYRLGWEHRGQAMKIAQTGTQTS
jgi:hypothetical protein